MDDSTNKPAPEAPAPEVAQLLKMLELQTAAARRERRSAAAGGLQGTPFRYGSLAAILLFAFGSVGLMEWFVSQLPRPVPHTQAAAGEAGPFSGMSAGKANSGTGAANLAAKAPAKD